MRKTVLVFVMTILAGCTLGPNYQRPAVQTPASFRAPTHVADQDFGSLADLKWWEIFKDEKLQNLERVALTQNFDLRDVTARVEAARANVRIVRSNQFPNVGAGASLSTVRVSRDGSSPLPAAFVPSQTRTFGGATLNLLSFEADIWGRLRRSTEAARAQLLSADYNRQAVVTTLVAEVATAYFTLRELDHELAISERTLATRQASLELIKQRQAGGIATLIDLRQGEQLVYTASQAIPSIKLEIEQTENRINLLLGRNPGPIERGKQLTEQEMPPEVPAGLPSALLERRPDIRAAEETLIAANAQIGVAKAAYFPQVTLTGFLGGQSTQLANLFSATSGVWGVTPQITQPIFTAGRLKSNVKLTEALHESALAQYEKSIQSSFSEVSDALTAHQRLRESRIQQELLLGTLRDRTRLAYVRYRGGVDTLLNALDADRDQYQAELALAQIQLSELNAIVQLYKALGGGWQ